MQKESLRPDDWCDGGASERMCMSTALIASLVTFTVPLHTPHVRGCRNNAVRSSSSVHCLMHRPYSWEELHLHAANQSARYAASEYPGRSPDGNAMYDEYKQWCVEHGKISNAEYVLKYVNWQDGVALEPSLAPYLLEDGIEHWILWHHPDRTQADVELDREEEARLALAFVARQGGVQLDPADLVCYQNVPALRSIPTIAHSHVFLRVGSMPPASRQAVARMRSAWRSRSPWLQAADQRNKDAPRTQW